MVSLDLKSSQPGGSKMGISQEQKQQVVERMQTRQAWLEAIEQVGVKVCQFTAYRWVRYWRDKGEAGLSDGRHGHLYKMTPEIQGSTRSCDLLPRFETTAPSWYTGFFKESVVLSGNLIFQYLRILLVQS
jgi:transposase